MTGKWKHDLLRLLLCFMVLLPAGTAEAAGTKTVTGTCNYDYAYQVLEIVNQERSKAGLQTLTMDSELLAVAMLRAAECTVKFDHVRPNGEKCFSVNSRVYAENIAYGQSTPTEVMKSWMGSSGHKTNILNKSYKSIGIGCFKKGGVIYWVQCFGPSSGDNVSNPGNHTDTYDVATSAGGETLLTNSDKINPLTTKVSGFKATAGKKKLTLKWKSKGGISGYEIQISTNKSYKKAQSYMVGKKKTSTTIKKYNGKKLKSKQRYYVRIRAYIQTVNDQGNVIRQYSKWSKLNVKVK